MEYDLSDTGKKKSDIKKLEEIAKEKGLSDNFLDTKLEQDYTLGDFLAETIGIVSNPNFSLEIQEKELREELRIASLQMENSPLYASINYITAGKKSLAISGRFKDKTLSNVIKGCFSSASKCDKMIIKKLADKGEYELSKKYEASSTNYKLLSDKSNIIQELLFDYFKKEQKIDNMLKNVDKNEITFPFLMNHPSDWIDILDKYAKKYEDINSNEMQQRILTEYVLCEMNYLKKYKNQELHLDSKEVQKTIKTINTNSNFLELNPNKIELAIKHIFPEYQNKN